MFLIAAFFLLFGNSGLLDTTFFQGYGQGVSDGLPGSGGYVGASSIPSDWGRVSPERLAAPSSADQSAETPAFRLRVDPALDRLGVPGGEIGPAGKTSSATTPSSDVGLSELHPVSLRQMFGLDVGTIVIDPGHGGADPGTAGKMGLQEKVVALDIAKRLKAKLDSYGRYNVLLTREEDVTLSLNDRIAFANSHQADLFISIHVNYLPSRPNNIIETYYFGLAENDAILELALRENADSMVGLNEFREMGERLGGTLKLQESKRLASTIQESLFMNISRDDETVLDMGIKKAPFLVIMGTEMPGVLAEVTCLSNKEQELRLRTTDYREDIASYMETGILNYLNKGDYVYEARRR